MASQSLMQQSQIEPLQERAITGGGAGEGVVLVGGAIKGGGAGGAVANEVIVGGTFTGTAVTGDAVTGGAEPHVNQPPLARLNLLTLLNRLLVILMKLSIVEHCS